MHITRPIQNSAGGSWRGHLMVAAKISDDNAGLRIHLADTDGGTLCGSHLRMDVADHNVSTGWPDCQPCIDKVKAQDKPTWMA